MDLSPHSYIGPFRRLAGFGQTEFGDSRVCSPTSNDEVAAILQTAAAQGRQVLLRGAGRSYGDASIAGETVAIRQDRVNRVLGWDPATGTLDVEGGITLEEIWRYVLPDGFWPPVVSGTMKTSVAGGLAMNIHGKNNWSQGTLGEHVDWMDVMLASGEVRRLVPTDPLFFQVVSGFGLLGIILRARLRMKRIRSGSLQVVQRSVRNWQEQFDTFEEFQDRYEYIVSWVDGFHDGRGTFQAANHHPDDEPHTLHASAQELSPYLLGCYPKSRAWRTLRHFTNPTGMRLLSAAKYRAGRLTGSEKAAQMPLVAFHFPLDFVQDWERAYLPGGLLQFQVGLGRHNAREVIPALLARSQAARLWPYLIVLKRHRPDPTLMSYLIDGYSIAMDFHRTDLNAGQLDQLFKEMTTDVLAAGGKFYMAKDARLTADEAKQSLGEGPYHLFLATKRELDPTGLLVSALGARIGLCEMLGTPKNAS